MYLSALLVQLVSMASEIPSNPIELSLIFKNFESSCKSFSILNVPLTSVKPEPAKYALKKSAAGIETGVPTSVSFSLFIANVRINDEVSVSNEAPDKNWSLGILIISPNSVKPSLPTNLYEAANPAEGVPSLTN